MRRFEERLRAHRFTIHAPLSYRTTGDREWHEGTMVNISESGVLFQTYQEMPLNREIEMRFSLSTGVAGKPTAQVACRCEVARAISDPGNGMPMALAARIIKFYFGSPTRTPRGAGGLS